MNLFVFTLIAVALAWLVLVPVTYLLGRLLVRESPWAKRTQHLVLGPGAALARFATPANFAVSYYKITPHIYSVSPDHFGSGTLLMHGKYPVHANTVFDRAVGQLSPTMVWITDPHERNLLREAVARYLDRSSIQSPSKQDLATLVNSGGPVAPAVFSITHAREKSTVSVL
ncbi:hypothetical protein [Methyloceanibacter sp.]|uniref:hypothetical protein n=1 Tax=Methyloceanibacter sp. TaxID=1965321 RepID=UPI003D6D568D